MTAKCTWRWNWIGLVKDFIRFAIALMILHAGYPLTALGFLTFFDITVG